MSEDRIPPSVSTTKIKIPLSAPEELDLECTPDCPRSSKSFSNGNSAQKSGSPIGIRALFNGDDERPGVWNSDRSALRQIINPNSAEKGSSSPSRSLSASRSPLRRILNPQSSFRNGRSAPTSTSTSEYGRKKRQDSAEEAVPHPTSTHYTPEVCDANIASIIYSLPSQEKRIARAKWNRKIQNVKFPWFWKRKGSKLPECHLETKRTAFLSSEAKEQQMLRIENAQKQVEQGRHGKSSIEWQMEWEKGLRKYDSCSSWQRHIGQDTRKRYQRKLIKEVVQEKPFSKLQELRADAIMMENELFGTSKDVDDYKVKTHQICDILQSRRQSQRDKEATETETPKKIHWQESVAKARGKLKEFLHVDKSSGAQFGGNDQDSPTSTEESIPATPCNCKEKEPNAMCQSQNEGISIGKEGFRFQNVQILNRTNSPKKPPYQPKLKKIPPSYRDKHSAIGWNYQPRKDAEEFVNDSASNMSSHSRDDLYSNELNKLHGHPTKAQFTIKEELDDDDDDEWSIINAMGSLKFTNLFKCFG